VAPLISRHWLDAWRAGLLQRAHTARHASQPLAIWQSILAYDCGRNARRKRLKMKDCLSIRHCLFNQVQSSNRWRHQQREVHPVCDVIAVDGRRITVAGSGSVRGSEARTLYQLVVAWDRGVGVGIHHGGSPDHGGWRRCGGWVVLPVDEVGTRLYTSLTVLPVSQNYRRQWRFIPIKCFFFLSVF